MCLRQMIMKREPHKSFELFSLLCFASYGSTEFRHGHAGFILIITIYIVLVF